VKVILINHGPEDFTIRRGDRIAQLVIAPVVQAAWSEVASLDENAPRRRRFRLDGRSVGNGLASPAVVASNSRGESRCPRNDRYRQRQALRPPR
jgi:hypothetical protein